MPIPENSLGGWSRFLGVTLRPWAGAAPLSLIVRGAIQCAVCVFFSVLVLRIAGSPEGTEMALLAGGGGSLRGWAVIVIAFTAVVAAIGACRVVVGILDLVPRRSVTGTVVSLRERRVLDVLPVLGQRALFENRQSGIDKRRARTEVVLRTDTGDRQWTVRAARIRRDLRVGARVRLSVTPIAGYVARAEELAGAQGRTS